MIRRYILLALCVSLSCFGYAQKKNTKVVAVRRETAKSVQTETNHPPLGSPIVKELKKIDYAEITQNNILIPNCATELDDDGTVPVDEAEYSIVKGIVAKDVIAANSLEEELNTPLKKKHYMESEDYKYQYEFLLDQRTCILDHEYFIESDFDSEFDLDSHTFSFYFDNPNCMDLRFSSDDAQCSMEGSKFTTTPLSEDLAYQIETNKVKTFLVVKLGDELYRGEEIILIPQRIYLASLKDGKILYIYEFAQNVSSDNSKSENEEEEVTTQVSTEAPNKVSEIVEETPKYPGGEMEILRSLAQNLEYPVKAQEQGIQGRVIVKFVVEKDGSIGETKIGKSLSPECDKAAIDAVKKLKRFTPGKQNGEPVRVWYRIPVNFRIS